MKELNLNELVKIADDVDSVLYGEKSNDDLFRHLLEEIDELKEETDNVKVWKDDNHFYTKCRFEQLKELGDVLFCIISIARQNKLDMAHALSLTLTKLQERIKFNINE